VRIRRPLAGIPAAVGVDIGCGMIAVKRKFFAKDLPDNPAKVRTGVKIADN
jgi:hypothetical protein